MKRSATLLLLLAACGAAWAHAETVKAGGLLDGFVHPFTGGDHLLAMVAVGMWGAILGPPLVWSLPVTFPLLMVFGALVALAGFAIPGVELGVAASVIVLGACIAARWKAPVPIALAVVGFFGFLHGYAHGSELPASASPAAYAFGFVLASGFLHASGIVLGLLRSSATGERVVRLLGALSFAAGVWMLSIRVAAP